MEHYFISKAEVTKEEAIEAYQKAIMNDARFISQVDFDLVAVTEGYWVYSFLEGEIKNLDYLAIIDQKQTSGVIDSKDSYVSRDFIVRELKTKDFAEQVVDMKEMYLFNPDELQDSEEQFIEHLLDKTKKSICERHHLLLSQKGYELDVAPIREFSQLDKRYYLEKIYAISYYEKSTKKTYKSLYSTINQQFYELDYLKSKEFLEFYKLFKRPIVAIPKEYYQDYYQLAFEVYLKTRAELQYITEHELLQKAKKSVKYKEYAKYKDYLNQLIFYFKRRNYLTEFPLSKDHLKEEIFSAYLTLKYNPESGYLLAQKVRNGLLKDDEIKLLKISADLKNSYARKELYLYYASPQFYNESMMKRYS